MPPTLSPDAGFPGDSASGTGPRRRADLSRPEARMLAMLRLWPDGPRAQSDLWSALAEDLGPARARACLSAFETFRERLLRNAWIAPRLLVPEARRLSPDEDHLCRFVLLAAEGDREAALELATFLVRPAALLPLLHAAERTGLPLLCAECRLGLSRCRGPAQ